MMDRRAALQCLAAGAAWPLADRWISADVFTLLRNAHAAVQLDAPGTFRVLDSRAAETITAACDRIIPADETPGAVAASVPQFIAFMLAEWYEPEERDRFLRGLQILDARAQSASGGTFVQSTAAQQDVLLAAIDEEVQRLDVDRRSSHWFAMLKYLTVWGYCTSEVGMKTELGLYPQPMKYDGTSPYTPRT
jgi:hypothetical protein